MLLDVGPLHVLAFVSPIRLEYLSVWMALLLFAVVAAPIVLLGRRSLNGLGPVRKWVAIGIRLAVLLLLVLIIGGVRFQSRHKDLEVMVLRDISRSTELVTDYPGKTLQDSVDDYLRGVTRQDKDKRPDDRLGIISFKERALVDAMPDKELRLDTRGIRDPGTGTDTAAAIQLALATMSPDAMHRLLLIWDGNQTVGDLDAAVSAAAAQHVPIDVMPLHYDVRNETMVDRFVAPPLRRENEPFTIDVYLNSTADVPVRGKLNVLHKIQGKPEYLVNDMLITLRPAEGDRPGVTVQHIHVPALHNAGVHQFHATFTPDKGGPADAVTTEIGGTGAPGAKQRPQINKEADAFTIVRGEGKVLYVDNVPGGSGAGSPGQILVQAMKRQGIELQSIGIDQFPNNIIELQNYDAIVLANVPHGAGGIDPNQDKMIATYVHDMGGGLVMIGGDESFGAGGWQNTETEKVLPVDMEIPAQRQVGKGALVLIMHSCEMPQGNYWGEQCGIKAADALSEHDEIGVISYNWGGGGGVNGAGGSQWDFNLQERGDGSAVKAAIKNMKLGDMPSFDDSLNVALNGINGIGGLKNSNARHKHVTIISDGDPAAPNGNLVAQYQAAKVSVSTVTVYPHMTGASGRPPTMDDIANQLKGKSYGPIDSNPNQLPQIFIKEATVVRRSLIHEDNAGIPIAALDTSDDFIKGLADFPAVRGMVLTSRKNDPKVVVPLGAGKMNDPILAHWQAGLGKSAVFTSDAWNKWAARWVGSSVYDKLWAQIIRGVSRAPMSADFDVQTTVTGDKGKIVVEAFNKDSSSQNFLSVGGTVVGGQDMKEHPVRLVQTGPGTYEGTFDTNGPGNYVVALSYSGGPENKGGMLISGVALNNDPELRDLRSNDTRLAEIADRTGGRRLDPWEAQAANLFTRAGVAVTSSPMPIWDRLILVLLLLILIDVATRRIAWDWAATKRLASAVTRRVHDFTTVRKVESRQTLDALKRVRGEVAEQKFKPSETAAGTATPPPVPAAVRPDPKAKFQAKGVEGEITQMVGGATDKPIPPPPKKIEPKGGSGSGSHTGSLLEAKRRAQQQIKRKEQGE